MEALLEGSRWLDLPKETAKELIRYLLVQKFSGSVGTTFLPSSSLERLLHFVLVNTHVRCAVEEQIGKIEHVEPSKHLDFSSLSARARTLYLWDRRHVFASFLLLGHLNIGILGISSCHDGMPAENYDFCWRCESLRPQSLPQALGSIGAGVKV